MTKKEKKVVFTLIGIMVVVLLIVVIVKTVNKPEGENLGNTIQQAEENEEKYVTELADGTKLNNSEELNNTHTYKGVEISNIQFTSQNGSSVLLADVKNTGSETFEEEEATIVLIGENNEEREIAVYIPSLSAGETKQINSIVTADVVNVKDFRIEAR